MKKIIPALLLLAFGYSKVSAQKITNMNLPYYDDRQIHYGFFMGINSSGFNLRHSAKYTDLLGDSVVSLNAPSTGGFSLGFIFNVKLQDHFDFRLQPTVGFYERKLDYEFANKGKEQLTTEVADVELPFLIKYKSLRRKNTRMYLIAGLKPSMSTTYSKRGRNRSVDIFEKYNLSFDYGFGLNAYFKMFRFSPEIRFSHGLLQQKNNDPSDPVYGPLISRMNTHTVTLFFIFE